MAGTLTAMKETAVAAVRRRVVCLMEGAWRVLARTAAALATCRVALVRGGEGVRRARGGARPAVPLPRVPQS